MCLLALAHRYHEHYPLVLVANRDEFYDRPARMADWWRDHPNILAGRDLRGGGTWLGVARDGRWAAVTNYREGRSPSAPRSRGELVVNYLCAADPDPEAFARGLQTRYRDYDGFNLLAGVGGRTVYCGNRGGETRALAPGLYTLSNHLLDTPWPKSEQARFKLASALRDNRLAPESLLSVLSDTTPVEDPALLPATGIDPDLERTLSPPFIVGEEYGTRCTTVLMIDSQGEARFLEQNFLRGEALGDPRVFSFSIA